MPTTPLPLAFQSAINANSDPNLNFNASLNSNFNSHPSTNTEISSTKTPSNPLPPLLQTPLGLALIEIQGTLNLPAQAAGAPNTSIGHLVFPLLSASDGSEVAAEAEKQDQGQQEGEWMKRVELYIGKNQRLVGEIKGMKGALGVVRRVDGNGVGANASAGGIEDEEDVEAEGEGMSKLAIVDIVRWKIVFKGRPEFV